MGRGAGRTLRPTVVSEDFGRLYDEIFKGLNAAQAVAVVLILQNVEARRRRVNAEAAEVSDFIL